MARSLFAAGTYLAMGVAMASRASANTSPAKPHILMILSDDFGWADIGYHNVNPVGGVPADNALKNLTATVCYGRARVCVGVWCVERGGTSMQRARVLWRGTT